MACGSSEPSTEAHAYDLASKTPPSAPRPDGNAPSTGMECAVLSYVKSYRPGVVNHVEQQGCDRFVQYQLADDERVDGGTIEISPRWTETPVDDEHEAYTNRQRWMWSADRQKLLHEYVIDSLDKATGITTFTTASTQLYASGGKIRETGHVSTRKQSAAGEITIESKPVANEYEASP
jgi:hypothetical protein